MGTNRRYGAEARDESAARVLARQAVSLTAPEVGDRITRAKAPVPVRAWVRFGADARLVEAVSVAWTPRAACIRFPDAGAVVEVWVWASACERR